MFGPVYWRSGMPLTIEGLSAVWALAAMVVPFSRRSSRPTREFVDGVVAQTDALYRAALRLTRDASEAEDLVQETCLKAFRSCQRFAAGSNLRAWLFTILMNTFRNQRRDAARDLVDV